MRGCFLTRSHPDFNQPLKPLYYTPPLPTVPVILSSYLPQDTDWSSIL